MDESFGHVIGEKVVAVTGATSGIGHAVALAFARHGARVVANGRRGDLGRILEERAAADGGKAIFVEGDVRRPEDCRALVDVAVERFGRLDVMIANAGTIGDDPLRRLDEIDEQWWDEMIDINLKGMFLTCQAAARPMVAQGEGVLVLIGSETGAVPGSDMIVYRTAKAGVLHLGRCLRPTLDRRGVEVHTVVMGSVETPGRDRYLRAWHEKSAVGSGGRRRRHVPAQPGAVAEGIVRLVADPGHPPGPNFTLA